MGLQQADAAGNEQNRGSQFGYAWLNASRETQFVSGQI